MLLTRENTTMRSLHVATREKPEQQQRPSPAKNKEIDTVIKTLGENLLLLACSGPFLFFQPGCSLMMTLLRHLLLDLSSRIKLSIINTQCSTQNNPFIHLPHFTLITSFPGPQCLKKIKINSFLNHNQCK